MYGLMGAFWLIGVVVWTLTTLSAIEQRRYRSVEAEVVKVEKKRGAFDRLSHNCSTGDDRGPRQIYVTYRYTVAGESYTGTRYDATYDGELFCAEEPALARVEELQREGRITVHYDPEQPSRAVISKEDWSEIYTVIALLTAAGIVIWGLFVRQTLRFRRWREAGGSYTD